MGFLSKARIRWDKSRKEKVGVSGGLPLTIKQFRVIIQRTVYAAVNYERWTLWKPVRAQWIGLVSIETWNKANRGKWYIRLAP